MANNEKPIPVHNVNILGMKTGVGNHAAIDMSGALFMSGTGLFFSRDGGDASEIVAEV